MIRVQGSAAQCQSQEVSDDRFRLSQTLIAHSVGINSQMASNVVLKSLRLDFPVLPLKPQSESHLEFQSQKGVI